MPIGGEWVFFCSTPPQEWNRRVDLFDALASLFGYVPKADSDDQRRLLRESLASLADAESRACRAEDALFAKSAVIDSLYEALLPGEEAPEQLGALVADIKDQWRAIRHEAAEMRSRALSVSQIAADIAQIKQQVALIVY